MPSHHHRSSKDKDGDKDRRRDDRGDRSHGSHRGESHHPEESRRRREDRGQSEDMYGSPAERRRSRSRSRSRERRSPPHGRSRGVHTPIDERHSVLGPYFDPPQREREPTPSSKHSTPKRSESTVSSPTPPFEGSVLFPHFGRDRAKAEKKAEKSRKKEAAQRNEPERSHPLESIQERREPVNYFQRPGPVQFPQAQTQPPSRREQVALPSRPASRPSATVTAGPPQTRRTEQKRPRDSTSDTPSRERVAVQERRERAEAWINEATRFPPEAQAYWPRWMTRQNLEFRTLLFTLVRFRDIDEGQIAGLQAIADNIIMALTDAGGITFHIGSQFPIGGPGAHPEDIMDLFRDAGWYTRMVGNTKSVDEKAWKRTSAMIDRAPELQRVIQAARDYIRSLRGDRPTPLLGATSGSARVRAEIRGVQVAYNDLERPPPGQTSVPRSWARFPQPIGRTPVRNMLQLLGLPEGQGGTIPRALVAAVQAYFRDDHITREEAENIIAEGGMPREQSDRSTVAGPHHEGRGWRSLQEILQTMTRSDPETLREALQGSMETRNWRWWATAGSRANENNVRNWDWGAWRFVEQGGNSNGLFTGVASQLNPELRQPPSAADQAARRAEQRLAAHRVRNRSWYRAAPGADVGFVRHNKPTGFRFVPCDPGRDKDSRDKERESKGDRGGRRK